MRVEDEQVLEFIRTYTSTNGFPPTVREIAERMEVASPSTAWSRLERLKEQGRVSWVPGKSRSFTLPSTTH